MYLGMVVPRACVTQSRGHADPAARIGTDSGLDNNVSVIRTASREVARTIAVGEAPWGVVIDD